ncbi:MAG: amidohydrolase family protein [Chthonomonadales bacterium]
MNFIRPWAFTSILATAILIPGTGIAQTGPVTIIEHARIITGDGPAIEDGYIVWQDSVIKAVGSGEAPSEFTGTKLEGKGATVYPGFIDAYCFAGITVPASPTTVGPPAPASRGGGGGQNRPAQTPAPPMVWRKATDVFKVPENVFAAMRNSGFTTANLVVRGTLTPGEMVTVNVSDKKTPDVLKDRAGINLNTLTRGFNSYPSTLMAAFTFLRQTFYDGMDSVNHPPAKPDPKLECFAMAASGGLPVVISAGAENDILRAIRLSKEFNFKPTVVNSVLPDGISDRIKAAGASVIVTGDGDGIPSLDKAKVPFAIASGSIDMSVSDADELLTRLRALNTKKSASKESLVAAVTSVPASILGMTDSLGSIKVGKVANLTIFDGDLFEAKSLVKYVVVNGAKIDRTKVAADMTPKPIRTAADGVPYKTVNYDDADGDGE